MFEPIDEQKLYMYSFTFGYSFTSLVIQLFIQRVFLTRIQALYPMLVVDKIVRKRRAFFITDVSIKLFGPFDLGEL